MTDQPEEPGAGYQSRATGLALAGIGGICALAGFTIPFFVDVYDPQSPAIGVGGLRMGGLLFIAIGIVMYATAEDDS